MVSVDKQGEAEDEAPAAVGDEPESSDAPRDNGDSADTSRTFPLDVTGAGADRLRTTVKTKLSEFMGSYTDDVLAAYVVVLVGHGKQRKQAISDLEAFLGSQSEAFVSWLWEHLTENLNDYAQPIEESEKEIVAHESKERAVDEKPDAAKDSEQAAAAQAEKPKRSRSPEPWSRRRRTRTETKEEEPSPPQKPADPPPKKPADPPPPRLRAPRRLLEFAVRDAVAPSTSISRRSVDATTKRLRSVVATDHDKASDANGKLKARPTIAKQTKSSPAMLIALKAAAAAAEDVANRKPAIKALSRFTSSVWDRLGGKSDDELDHQNLREAEVEITEKMEYVHLSNKKAGERHLRKSSERPRTDPSLPAPAHHSYDEDQSDQQAPEEAPRKESKRHSVKKERRQTKPERLSQTEKQKALLLAERRSKTVEKNHGGAREKTVDVPDGKDQDVSEMRRMRQVEIEVSKLRTKQVEAAKPAAAPAAAPAAPPAPAPVAQSSDADSRTITVSNVLVSTTKEALSAHFASCGEVLKTTILTDAAGKPKGAAHVEFASKEAADKALAMNDSSFNSRPLKVARNGVAESSSAAVAGAAAATGGAAAPRPAAVMMRPVRMPIRAFPRAAFMRGSPYSMRPPPPRLLRPSFPVSAPHLQWKRDGASSTPTTIGKNGFRSSVGPIRKRSLSYVRPVVPSIPEAAAALPVSADDSQKGS